MKKCPNCGNECEDSMNFCPNCHAKLLTDNAKSEASKGNSKATGNKKIGIVCGICGLLLIVAVVVVVVLFCGGSSSDGISQDSGAVSSTQDSGAVSSTQDSSTVNSTTNQQFKGYVMLPGNVCLDMIRVKSGSFQMGSPRQEEGRCDNEEQHTVILTKDYWLGKYEVTQEQWEAVMGHNKLNDGHNLPVVNVDWYEAMEFCRKLNGLCDDIPNGYQFSLPTEAQWEYACRAGTTTAYSFGTSCKGKQFNRNCSSTCRVGSYPPNNWGFYDMHGNVWEWCLDWAKKDLGSAAVTDPVGANTGSRRVLRGGSYAHIALDCRSASRYDSDPSDGYSNYGFRVALVPSVQ